ncbi:MAG: hypothetical protein FWC00_04140 [Firmicutes bacterium]|nr:hypothetical protein [Bacillota bacterium]
MEKNQKNTAYMTSAEFLKELEKVRRSTDLDALMSGQGLYPYEKSSFKSMGKVGQDNYEKLVEEHIPQIYEHVMKNKLSCSAAVLIKHGHRGLLTREEMQSLYDMAITAHKEELAADKKADELGIPYENWAFDDGTEKPNEGFRRDDGLGFNSDRILSLDSDYMYLRLFMTRGERLIEGFKDIARSTGLDDFIAGIKKKFEPKQPEPEMDLV